ncbi:MAG: hypothetical protein OXE94_03055 [Aestuariivita sp.]|nr:hypothetical protein [Aestuariivita sp.]MCY4201196.1 hypothetical protein [Aestuariivita sp.]MCY4288974.1 hypothetical protein [Aestuariivita sp.]MCY4346563.1 hypothetical protein [Aestuariivita sp.]
MIANGKIQSGKPDNIIILRVVTTVRPQIAATGLETLLEFDGSYQQLASVSELPNWQRYENLPDTQVNPS